MVSKILLTLGLFGLITNKPINNLSSFSTKEPNAKSNVVYTQCYYAKSDATKKLITLTSDFSFGYLGEEETQDVYFNYKLLSNVYSYYCYFTYTTFDGKTSGYEKAFDYGNAGEKVGILTINRNELPSNEVYFKFYLAAFNSYNDIFVDNPKPLNHLSMNFVLHNKNGFVSAAGYRNAKVYYYYEFILSESRYRRYYDELYLDLDSYNNLKTKEIYFRLKPEDFVFKSVNIVNSTEAKLYILNNNGSFNDCTEYDSLGRYFPMVVNSLGKNLYSLSYKNISKGGKKNLYLDPLSMHMYLEKRNNYYEVKNIYLPKKSSEIYKTIKVMPVFTNFGSNLIDAGIPFTITIYENYIENYFYTIGRIDEIGNDSSGEEIKPWQWQYFILLM